MSRLISVLMMVLVLVFGIFIGSRLNRESVGKLSDSQSKMDDAYRLISSSYVDPVNGDSLASAGIQGMVQSLDPHTVYLEPEKAAYSNAEFKGNFDGIGIEFDVVRDTLLVVTPLAGGPSDAVGMMPGDRIIAIDSKRAIGISASSALRRLRGERGSKINLTIYRPLTQRTIDFTVTRGKISTSSIGAAFLDADKTGYIRISQFVATTSKEFRNALDRLLAQGMRRLIIDVRGNPGGFLDQAVAVADELLADGKLIVYTKSRHGGEDQLRYSAKSGGLFESGQLCLLVDRGSASAAEILAGALQDDQRAVVIGELTFGKGLVQRQFSFSDGSALRLTVSRYYTPSGRQIQRSYDEGLQGRERYYKERFTRDLSGSFMKKYGGFVYGNAGDISVYSTGGMTGAALSDSLKGELSRLGGIMPDYWVFGRPYTTLYQELYARGVIEDIALKLIDDPKSHVQQYRDSADAYFGEYHGPTDLKALIGKECAAKKIAFSNDEFNRDRSAIALALKARIARQLFGTEEQIRVLIREGDPVMKVARHFIEKEPS